MSKATKTTAAPTTPVVNIENGQPATDAPATQAEPAEKPATKPEPQSPKLTELKEQRKAKWIEAQGMEYDSAEQITAFTEVVKIDGLIKAEKAAIEKAEKDAELAEKRNARVALLDEVLESYKANLDALGNESLSIDEKNAINDRYQKAREVVTTELLARYATSSPSKSVATGDTKPAGERGATGKVIHEKLTAYIAGGQSSSDAVKSVIAEGFSRGTVGAVRTQMVKDGEIAS